MKTNTAKCCRQYKTKQQQQQQQQQQQPPQVISNETRYSDPRSSLPTQIQNQQNVATQL